MIANFGYTDGSGEYYIMLDTDKCNGCGACVPACRAHILELRDNEYAPLAATKIVVVKDANRKRIKYDCAPCKPASAARALRCVTACKPGAIAHSW